MPPSRRTSTDWYPLELSLSQGSNCGLGGTSKSLNWYHNQSIQSQDYNSNNTQLLRVVLPISLQMGQPTHSLRRQRTCPLPLGSSSAPYVGPKSTLWRDVQAGPPTPSLLVKLRPMLQDSPVVDTADQPIPKAPTANSS